MASLFELSQEAQEIESILDNWSDETAAAGEEALSAFFERVKSNPEELKKKVDNYLWLIKDKRNTAEGRKAESVRLAELASRGVKQADKLEERLFQFMTDNGREEFATDYHELKIVGSGGVCPLVARYEKVEDLPKKYRVEKREWKPDNDAIRKGIEAGDKKLLTLVELGEKKRKLKIK
jgi:hypothetical protein